MSEVQFLSGPLGGFMRVALLLFGQPRYAEATFPKMMETIIAPNNADVFIHTWLDDTIIGKQMEHFSKDGETVSDVIPDNILDRLYKLYKPKALACGVQPDMTKIADSRVPIEERINVALYNQHTSAFKADLLRRHHQQEHGFIYDMVIRSRFDCFLNYVWNASSYDPNVLHIPYWMNKNENMMSPVLDQFAWGNDKCMGVYADMIMFINEMVDIGVWIQSEFMIHFHLTRFNVPFRRVNANFNFTRNLIGKN